MANSTAFNSLQPALDRNGFTVFDEPIEHTLPPSKIEAGDTLTPVEISRATQNVSLEKLRELGQAVQDSALERVWPYMALQMTMDHPELELGSIKKASEVRDWICKNSTLVEGIQELNFPGLGITVLPGEIGKFTGLTKLDLSRNALQMLPEEMSQLVNLRELHITSHAPLLLYAAEIVPLSRLEAIGPIDSQLKALLAEISRLTKLDKLMGVDNQLQIFK